MPRAWLILSQDGKCFPGLQEVSRKVVMVKDRLSLDALVEGASKGGAAKLGNL